MRACGLLLAATVGCAWPAWAQFGAGAPEGAATITSMTGRVDVMRDSIPYVLNSGDWVKPGQMVVTGPDGWALFKLPDGSTFEVFANAHVVFRASPGNWTEADGMIVSLEAMLNHDPSLADLGNLPRGWRADRDRLGGPWGKIKAG